MQFLFPISPNAIVTQTFAEHVRRAQVNGWQYYYGGIDWAIPTGSQVKAAQAGTVQMVRTDATGYGTHVRIQHAEGYLTIYAHLQDFRVTAGQQVAAGEVIARSDNTGNSTGPHLHFELRLNGVPIDPAPLLVTSLDGGGPGGGAPGGGTSGEAPPPGETEFGEAPASYPKLPKVRVTSGLGLNIRQGPGITSPVVGFLPTNTEVEVLRSAKQGADTWLQIGNRQFIAQTVNGEVFSRWLKDN